MQWTFAPGARVSQMWIREQGFQSQLVGEQHLLFWKHGAVEADPVTAIFWGGRYAALTDKRTLRVIGSETAHVTHIALDDLASEPREMRLVDDILAINVAGGSLWIPCADLARCTEAPGAEAVLVTDDYPERNPTAAVLGRVVDVLATEVVLDIYLQPFTRQVRVPRDRYNFTPGMKFRLVDELYWSQYASIDLPGEPRQVWFEPSTRQRTVHVRWEHEIPSDPLASSKTFIADPRADALLAAGDSRRVLIDLLGDAGEECAETFALLAAGKRVAPARRMAALGPLAHVIDEVSYRDGLPWAAQLAQFPPHDAGLIAVAARDVRLAMLETFRHGHGPNAVYRTLVETRVLPSLRRAEVRSVGALRALLETGYTQLVELWGVPFSKVALGLLHEPALANLRRIEFHAAGGNAPMFPALAEQLVELPDVPRELTFVSLHQHVESLIRAVAPRFSQTRATSLSFHVSNDYRARNDHAQTHITVTRRGRRSTITLGQVVDGGVEWLFRSLVA